MGMAEPILQGLDTLIKTSLFGLVFSFLKKEYKEIDALPLE